MTQKEEAIARHGNVADMTTCKECGRSFKLLGRHVVVTHGISVKDYKTRHGIPLMVPLCSMEFRDNQKANIQERVASDPLYMSRMALKCPPGSKSGWRRQGPFAGREAEAAAEYREKRRREAAELWESRREEFTKKWHAGETRKAMAEHYGCCVMTIHTYTKLWSLPSRAHTILARLP